MSAETFSAMPINVLLVEDNEDDVELTIDALRESKLKISLDVVKDGTQAMDYLYGRGKYDEPKRPDLILLDLNLPHKDGREVLAEIKNDKNLRRIPVVVLTISQNEEDVERAYDLHANCYITKPVDFDQFVKVVREVEGFWLTVVKLP
jgi:two-component system response regulator